MIQDLSRKFSIPVRWLGRSRDEHSWRWRSRHPDVFRVRDMVGDEPCLWLIPICVVRGDGPVEDSPQDAARELARALQGRARRARDRRAVTSAVDHLAAIKAADQPDHGTVDGCQGSLAGMGEMVIIADAEAGLKAAIAVRPAAPAVVRGFAARARAGTKTGSGLPAFVDGLLPGLASVKL